MRILATMLFPVLMLAIVGYTLVLPAMESIGHISQALAVALPR